MAEFGRLKALALRRVLKLENGVPSHDTFSRVFRLLEPTGFYESFLRFMTAFAEARGGVIAVDGKTLRRSFDRAAKVSSLHLVSAWASEERVVSGQIKVADGFNEIEALAALLDL